MSSSVGSWLGDRCLYADGRWVEVERRRGDFGVSRLAEQPGEIGASSPCGFGGGRWAAGLGDEGDSPTGVHEVAKRGEAEVRLVPHADVVDGECSVERLSEWWGLGARRLAVGVGAEQILDGGAHELNSAGAAVPFPEPGGVRSGIRSAGRPDSQMDRTVRVTQTSTGFHDG